MKKIYSLFDTVSEQYGNPFISINDKVAVRSVIQFFDDSEKQAKEHGTRPLNRNEFALYFLGYWDETSGEIKASLPTVVSKWSDDGENFLSLLNAMPGACAQGLIWGITAIGIYITYKILDIADLTVDGSLGTGGAVCIMMMMSGKNVYVSML